MKIKKSKQKMSEPMDTRIIDKHEVEKAKKEMVEKFIDDYFKPVGHKDLHDPRWRITIRPTFYGCDGTGRSIFIIRFRYYKKTSELKMYVIFYHRQSYGFDPPFTVRPYRINAIIQDLNGVVFPEFRTNNGYIFHTA
jgi:hypothetical protein